MSTAITHLGSLLAILATLTCLALASLVSEELRTRINRLPFLVLSLAARRLPPELRSEIYHEEWLPELCYLMEGDRIGPVTRLFRATRFALSVWLRRGGERMARELAAHSLSMKGFADIRTLSRARRREFTTLTTRLRELLSNDVGAPDRDWAARLLTATAIACEACIEDRDERTAESLAQATSRLASWLDADHPAVLRVRRAAAYATLQLGHDEQATSVLRALCADEQRIFGPHHPGTFPTRRRVNWALADAGRFPQAEAGFRALHADLACLPTADPSLRWHVQCMLSWTVACQGRLSEAEYNYDAVIAGRSRQLGPEHPDTLDTRHSKGKMFVLFGHGAQAYAILWPLLVDRGRVLGRHHPDTLETRKYLAVADALRRPHQAHAHRKAVRELRRILRRQTTKHGLDHPTTRDTRQWLAAFAGPTEKP